MLITSKINNKKQYQLKLMKKIQVIIKIVRAFKNINNRKSLNYMKIELKNLRAFKYSQKIKQ